MQDNAIKKQDKRKAIRNAAIILLVTGVLLTAVWIHKKRRDKKKLFDMPDSLPASDASKPVKSSAPSLFPLKLGSPQNDLVRQLQRYLGITADGVWGPKTQAAFTAKTGKTQIVSQADFDSIIKSLQTKAASSNNGARAIDLTKQWNANGNLKMMAIKRAYYFGVTQDAFKALNNNGDNGSFDPNVLLSRGEVIPKGDTTLGFLLIEKKPAKPIAGKSYLYKVDPNMMTVG